MSTDIDPLSAAVARIAGIPLLATGSGGSLTAAHVAANLHERYCDALGKSVTPSELISSPMRFDPVSVLFLSAAGRNVDIVRAFREVALREPHQSLVLCGREKSPLADSASGIDHASAFSYDLPSRRDGFLATNSLLAFIVLICRAWSNAAGVKQDLPATLPEISFDESRTLDELWSKQNLIVLFGNNTASAAIDLESKFTEAALGSTLLSDYRNFAHGRHHWIAKHPEETAIIAFAGNDDRRVARKTLDLIPDSIPILEIPIHEENEAATLTSLLHVYRLTASAGKFRGIDPGRPGVPDFGRRIYHLKSNPIARRRRPKDLPDGEIIAIERKSGRREMELEAEGRLNYWRSAYRSYVDSIEAAIFGGVIFDYDGTLCSPANRWSGLETSTADRLTGLLERSIPIGIATGRGDSVAEDFRKVIPSKYHKSVLVGYYNGGTIARLNDILPAENERNRDESLQELVRVLEGASDSFDPFFTWVSRNLQLRVQPCPGYSTIDILRIIRQTLEVENISGLSVLYSSHSIDVVAPGVSKLRLFEQMRTSLQERSEILCVGDRGRFPGNDYLLLSGPYSLSVDECSFDPRSCWNLAPPGLRGVQATDHYFECFEVHDKTFTVALSKKRKR